MITAMFRAMLLTLLNDRGALALAFLLPIIFFLIMAEIFSSATGVNMQLHVAFADETGGERSRRLLDNLRANDGIVAVGGPDLDRQQARELVGKGAADFGLVMRANARRLDDVGGFGSPPILLINDPVRAGMVPMISGQIQKSYFDALPDVALASVIGLIEDQFVELDSEQRIVIDEGLAQMRDEAQAGGATGWTFAEMIETQSVGRQSASRSHVAYYAGAVTCMFLLFSNVQSAISLTEERQSGILERIMAGPGGMAVLVNGKFLFLLAMGCLQLLLVFITAWVLYGVDLPGQLVAWLVISILASAAAAGISLFIAAICRTLDQARNLSTILVLIASAIGGCMVPRFFYAGMAT